MLLIFLEQAESIMSDIRRLQELIDQSHTIIQMNLDSQRNIMLRLSLQLSMGMFSATVAGLIGMAFGMNLDSSLEEVSVRACVRVCGVQVWSVLDLGKRTIIAISAIIVSSHV